MFIIIIITNIICAAFPRQKNLARFHLPYCCCTLKLNLLDTLDLLGMNSPTNHAQQTQCIRQFNFGFSQQISSYEVLPPPNASIINANT